MECERCNGKTVSLSALVIVIAQKCASVYLWVGM